MTAAIRRSIWSVLVAQPAVVDLVEQRLCLGYERPRIDRRLRLDGGRQLWGAVVGVDDPVDVAAELQPQAEVAFNWRLGHAASLRRFHVDFCQCRSSH